MSAHASSPGRAAPIARIRDKTSIGIDAGHDAFMVLRLAFAVAPLVFGIDKLFNDTADQAR